MALPKTTRSLRSVQIRRSGDDSNDWRVMAWVELAEGAAVAYSNANREEKVAAVADVALWVAKGLADVESAPAAAAFVDDSHDSGHNPVAK